MGVKGGTKCGEALSSSLNRYGNGWPLSGHFKNWRSFSVIKTLKIGIKRLCSPQNPIHLGEI
jgi:hypothetical protein